MTQPAAAPPTPATWSPADLFARIGGRATLERVVPDILALHLENPIVGARFRAHQKPIDELVRLVVDFFTDALSGTQGYDGLSMPAAHTGMAISVEEYVAVLDDIQAALVAHGIGMPELGELMFLNYGLKADIVGR